MKDTQKYVEYRQLRIEDYLWENREEPERNAEVYSISAISEEGRNDAENDEIDLLEETLSRDNLNAAYKKVKAKKGSGGVDGMKVDELLKYLKQNGEALKQSIRDGSYKPKPVRRVEIPKPDGGTRLLGVPTVVDRVIQQAIAQVLEDIYEEKFLETSYGFRPGKSAKDAIAKCSEYINAGYTWAVDIDLAKYFDTINHSKLLRLLSEDVKDGRVISLISKYLKCGVMVNGVKQETGEGAVQGGNISPLLSNVMLHELDKELVKRGLHFVRYADDCNIYVKSRKAAKRVMKSITRFIEDELKLKVNQDKSKVDRQWKLKFLGFSFYPTKGGYKIRVHEKSLAKLKTEIKAITGRSNGANIEVKLLKLKRAIVGWVNYFCIGDMKSKAIALDEWIRRRIRMCIWKQWKKLKTKHCNLKRLGLDSGKAWEYANTRKGYWRISNSPILSRTLTNKHLKTMGLVSVTDVYLSKR